MPHSVDNRKAVPFICEQCVHFLGECKCKAFDIIPIDIIYDAEQHNKIIEGQNGDYVFKAKTKRQFDRIYEIG